MWIGWDSSTRGQWHKAINNVAGAELILSMLQKCQHKRKNIVQVALFALCGAEKGKKKREKNVSGGSPGTNRMEVLIKDSQSFPDNG